MPRFCRTSLIALLSGCAVLTLMAGLAATPAFAQRDFYQGQGGLGGGYGGGYRDGQGGGYGRGERVQRERGARPGRERGPAHREGRRPGRGLGGAAIGIGAGIIGGILLDQALRAQRPEPEEPPPRRPRRPVIVEYDEVEEAAPRRPRRPPPVQQAAPPRRAGPPPTQTARPAPRRPGVVVPVASENRFVAEEILIELAPNAQAEAVLRRHRATLIASRRFELAGATIIRARLNDGRSARAALADMAGDPRIASAQPNYVYTLQQEAEAGTPVAIAPALEPAQRPAVAAPAATTTPPPPIRQPQYVVGKLRLEDAHRLARGERVRVAVIDSGTDSDHPELRGAVAGSFDALGQEPAPHAHGTAMAAAIAAQAQLQGVAPAARLLAARAFSGSAGPASASGTTFHILTAFDWAAAEGARVVNLSFAGPQDRLMSRLLAGARVKGIVSIAAAGNGGSQAAPLYPGADANVIAVTATDADDKPFAGANRGAYVAVAAPGVDVLAAEPQGRYAFSSGTSIAAAHVSGLAALILEKRPDLDLDGMRRLLMESAVDLGARGRDPIFGAGRVDAPAALARALPVTVVRP